jgi:hypothetical protein
MDSCREIGELLQEFGLSGTWLAQPAKAHHYQLQLSARMTTDSIPILVSQLALHYSPFELETHDRLPERFLYHPGLGIIRQQLNEAGEVLLREDSVLSAVALSRGSQKDLERRLRTLSGTAWLDLLEVYRNHDGVSMLPTAV